MFSVVTKSLYTFGVPILQMPKSEYNADQKKLKIEREIITLNNIYAQLGIKKKYKLVEIQ